MSELGKLVKIDRKPTGKLRLALVGSFQGKVGEVVYHHRWGGVDLQFDDGALATYANDDTESVMDYNITFFDYLEPEVANRAKEYFEERDIPVQLREYDFLGTLTWGLFTDREHLFDALHILETVGTLIDVMTRERTRIAPWEEQPCLFDCPPLIRRCCLTGNRRHGRCTYELQGSVQDCHIYQQKSS